MKIFKIVLLFILVVIAGFTGWHFYMKAIWDHHLVGSVNYMQIKSPLGEWIEIDEKNAESFISENDLIHKVELLRKHNEYLWVSNANKNVTKRVEFEGAWKFYIYETDDKSEFIKIRYNLFEVGGCDGRQAVWSSGNIEATQEISDGQLVLLRSHAYFYENPVQYLFCYELRQ